MSARLIVSPDELIEIPPPYPEPRIAFQHAEPRKANNLTLIEGKTFLISTGSVLNLIDLPGLSEVGFLHSDTALDSYNFPR